MKTFLHALPLALIACAAPADEPATGPASTLSAATEEPINGVCPRSGRPVSADSLTEYRGYVVGFCNPHCRDDFAAHVDELPDDSHFFDATIADLTKASR